MTPVDTERNLLFGLLALQNGLIDQGALFAAFAAWTRDRSYPLADHLIDLGYLDAPRRAVVEAIAGLHIQALGGDIEKSLAVLAVGRSTRESLARAGGPDVTATLGHVGSAHPSTRDDDNPDRTGSFSVGSATSDGQRFRIVRPHARGGLGAVFVALDSELNREVALKQILDDRADDPNSRSRFLIEAQITGGLEHPGIVPVYGLGAYADGRPYYAMRFIRGDSLKEAIDDFHEGFKAEPHLANPTSSRELALRKLLRRFMDVCNAIDYAHSRGVIHRDIKPANIIVGKHGETLVVDWGLAKPMGRVETGNESGERMLMPSSTSGGSETLPGSALGTPAYMSPEQADGQLELLGPRSDVYSLGATLYCLLTGRPPFAGAVVDVIRAVQRGESHPPRQLDPSIDLALEAICLKAMAHRAEDRYASGRALADDIDRWMADEPVTAWREPFSRRARRWARRNRMAVTAAAVALVAGVVGLSAVLVVQTRARAELAASLIRENQANSALANGNAKLTRSQAAVEARYGLAVEAIKIFHTGVSEDFLLKEDKFKDLRDRLLESASDFYGKLGALLGKETDPASRRALAQTEFEVADLTDKIGRKEAALEAHRRVLASREALAAGTQADVDAKADVGRSLTAIAVLLEETGKTDEAVAMYRKLEGLLAALAESASLDMPVRSVLADGRSRLGSLLQSMDKSDDALSVLRQAQLDQELLAAAAGATNETRRELAGTKYRIGVLLSQTGKPAEAEAESRNAVALYQKLVDDNPAVTRFHSELGLSRQGLGNRLWRKAKPSEAETEYRKSMVIFQKLVDDNPAVTEFRNRLAESFLKLGYLRIQTGNASEAVDNFTQEESIRKTLVEIHPSVPEYRYSLANCQNNTATVLIRLKRTAEARTRCEQAVTLLEVLVRDHPMIPLYRKTLGESLLRFGQARLSEKDLVGASADWKRAIALFKTVSNLDGEYVLFHAGCHALLSGLAGQVGSDVSADDKNAEAMRAMTLLRRAVGMGHRNPDTFRIEDALNPLRDRPDFRLLILDLGFPADPFAEYPGSASGMATAP